MKRFFAVTFFLCCILGTAAAGTAVQLSSPSGRVTAEVALNEGKLFYSVAYDGMPVLAPMHLSMSFSNGVVAGEDIRRLKGKTRRTTGHFEPAVAIRNAEADLVWNETEFKFPNYSVVFRLYDDAVCYRFVTRFKEEEIKVTGEDVEYCFVHDNDLLFPEEESMYTHQERSFLSKKANEVRTGAFCSHPLLATDGPLRVVVTEVDLESYPGIYYEKQEGLSFKGIFPHYPLKTEKRSDRDLYVTERAPYLAVTAGIRSYPWRVAVLASEDVQLLNTNTLHSLASPSRIADPSWIRPGKVAWDWWNAMTLTGVDFESGVNNATYRHFIDFAAANGLEYIILDEGWYDIRKGILEVVPTLDLEKLVAYGKEKKIGVILWTTWLALEENYEAAFERYAAMGIKGFKIDFMQRDDQKMVDWYYRTAARAAESEMLVDYHGSYKPTGLNITYPNVLNSEGVCGAENDKWSQKVTPDHNLTLPFTRMLNGPLDYTPGAMRNSLKGEFVARYTAPMSMGTRCHQLGMYVLYEAPLQMLSDSPSNYEKEPEMMQFLSAVPTTWEETRALEAAVGDYAVIARRHGDSWYLGAMTDWTARTFEVSLDFLEEGKDYHMVLWEDGPNVHKNAEDYLMRERQVKKGDVLTIRMAPGGGFAAMLRN